jgi:SAM-dependent methyltransferase
MEIMSKFLNQWRKPTGTMGWVLAIALNISHSRGTRWGLQQVTLEQTFSVLDVGCGGGRFVRELAEMVTQGRVYGVDYSRACVAVAKRTNRQWIKLGRVAILQSSVSTLPFPRQMFDLVTAVNSHYYWPDPLKDMQEILRVLKPAGRLLIIGEAYKGSKYEKRDRKFVELVHLAYYSLAELSELITSSGFLDVQVFEQYDRGWMCGIGRKAWE